MYELTDKQHAANLKMVQAHNNLQLLIGGRVFMSTIFNGPDGAYYDPIGDEVFIVTGMAYKSREGFPVYNIEFKDHNQLGSMKDHGFHVYLGPVSNDH